MPNTIERERGGEARRGGGRGLKERKRTKRWEKKKKLFKKGEEGKERKIRGKRRKRDKNLKRKSRTGPVLRSKLPGGTSEIIFTSSHLCLFEKAKRD